MSTIAAGIFFYCRNTSRFLYLLRVESKNSTWSIPGGKVEKDETLLEGVARECKEEMNFCISGLKLIPIQKFTNNDFVYNTFFCEVPNEFVPTLNNEHAGYAWVNEGLHPKPLHTGLFSTIKIDTVLSKLKLLVK